MESNTKASYEIEMTPAQERALEYAVRSLFGELIGVIKLKDLILLIAISTTIYCFI